jgi:hypothetical protein
MVSARRRAAIEAWKASGRSGPPPWAGVGGGPGGNPNHPGQGKKAGRGKSKREGNGGEGREGSGGGNPQGQSRGTGKGEAPGKG